VSQPTPGRIRRNDRRRALMLKAVPAIAERRDGAPAGAKPGWGAARVREDASMRYGAAMISETVCV
jgi:hypothetical protein